MTTTFYDVLRVPPEADAALLRHAYEQTLAGLARRLRASRQRGLDTAALERERQGLEEAWRVLADPFRRARYDRFLQLCQDRTTFEADELWTRVQSAMLDPTAGATLDLVHALTQLGVGDPRPPAPAPAPPAPLPLTPAAPLPAAAPQAPATHQPAPASAAAKAGPARAPAPAAAPVQVEVVQPPEVPAAAAPASSDPQSLIYELGFSGALLRRLREARGVSIDELAAATRIARRYIEAIEDDEFAALPAATFVRGYLRSLARNLGLDPERLAGGYMARMGR